MPVFPLRGVCWALPVLLLLTRGEISSNNITKAETALILSRKKRRNLLCSIVLQNHKKKYTQTLRPWFFKHLFACDSSPHPTLMILRDFLFLLHFHFFFFEPPPPSRFPWWPQFCVLFIFLKVQLEPAVARDNIFFGRVCSSKSWEQGRCWQLRSARWTRGTPQAGHRGIRW